MSVGKLYTCLACEKMNYCLTCILPEMGCCASGGAHQEHRVNHVARATVSADVIQLAAHEKDPAPEQAVSEGDASDSDGSGSASDSEQNDPPSSLVADAEQYVRKLGTRILLPPALLSKQQDSPQLPQWIVNPFRTTQAHQTRSVLFT